MTWQNWKPALALGAVLAAGAASAGDRDTLQLAGGAPGAATMTLGGSGTAAQAATEDNELMNGYRRGYYGRGYYGWNGGWGGYGYRGGYGGWNRSYGYGWNGWNGYYGGFRPYYGNYYYGGYRPAFYRSYYTTFPAYSYGCGPGFYLGIGGVGTAAPAVNLGGNFAQPVQPMGQPAAPGDGTFRYDGGPANPVPLPKADVQPIPPANPSSTASDLPVSGKAKTITSPSASPYKYKAYGEK